jgi:hypothetical protein
VGVGVVTGVLFTGDPVVGVGVVVAVDEAGDADDVLADDFPSANTANQSLSTPCPLAWPFLVSLTKV